VIGKLSWLAWLAMQGGDYQQARELGERAYRMAQEQDAPDAVVLAELSLGFAARREGKLDVAVTHLEHLLEIARREAGTALYLPMVLSELGYAAQQRGDAGAAMALHTEAFEAAEAMGAPQDAIGALEGMASVCPDPAAAGRLLGAAAAARAAVDVTDVPAERDERERLTARLVDALGEEAFQDAYRAGGGWSPAEAMRRAGTTR
jgi:tetratricopeptide (TPR) repeat protein